jgi:hypothetical protein
MVLTRKTEVPGEKPVPAKQCSGKEKPYELAWG